MLNDSEALLSCILLGGGEGVIFRAPLSVYRCGKSQHLLKQKVGTDWFVTNIICIITGS